MKVRRIRVAVPVAAAAVKRPRTCVVGCLVGLTLMLGCSTASTTQSSTTSGATPDGSMPPIPTLDTSGVIASTWSQGNGVAVSSEMILSEIAEPTLPPLIARVGWGAEGQVLLVTWGSSFCPKLPVDAVVENATTLRIRVRQVEPPEARTVAACSGDLSPTTSEFATPEGLDLRKPIDVLVGDTVQLTLPPQQ